MNWWSDLMLTSVQITQINAEASHFTSIILCGQLVFWNLPYKQTNNPSGLRTIDRFNYKLMLQLTDIPVRMTAAFFPFPLKGRWFWRSKGTEYWAFICRTDTAMERTSVNSQLRWFSVAFSHQFFKWQDAWHAPASFVRKLPACFITAGFCFPWWFLMWTFVL